MFTNGYELTTALTNLLISFASILSFFSLKKKRFINIEMKSLSLSFFYFLFISGILGFIMHGITINQISKDIVWLILGFTFLLVINSLLFLSLYKINIKFDFKKSIISAICLYMFIVLLWILKIEYLYYFIIYVCLSFIITVFINFKYRDTGFIYFLLCIIVQVIGGLFLIDGRIKFLYLDKNGIYHLFAMLSAICYYLSIKNNNFMTKKSNFRRN